jgi:hypothetical protein
MIAEYSIHAFFYSYSIKRKARHSGAHSYSRSPHDDAHIGADGTRAICEETTIADGSEVLENTKVEILVA